MEKAMTMEMTKMQSGIPFPKRTKFTVFKMHFEKSKCKTFIESLIIELLFNASCQEREETQKREKQKR